MAVFFTIAAVAFVQWLTTGPALADTALLAAMYTVAVESAWVFVAVAVAVLEAGVVMATVRWTPTGNDVKSLVFLTGLAIAALLAGVVVRALRSQLDWLAERGRALRSSAISRPPCPPPRSAAASPARCTTSSRTTSRSW